jgi:diguanylate cyclase (GGDEF)-like protein
VNRPARRLPWYLLAAGEASNLTGDLVGTIQRNVLHIDPYPSAADIFYLAAYPVLGVALVLLVRRRTPGSHTSAVIDSAVLSVALGLLWWLYLVRPMTTSDGTALERAVSVAYPVVDMLLLAIALRLALGVGARTTSFALLVGSLMATLLTDVVYAVLTAQNLYANTDTWLEWGWLVAYLLMGAAALHPSMRWLDRRAAVALRGASRRRVAVLACAALLPVGLLLAEYLAGDDPNIPSVVLAASVLFLLMLARLTGLARVQRKLAIHDGLTGAYSADFLDEAFRMECARVQATRGTLAVTLVDIDNFALVNEVYGHMGGDLVLAEVAARLHRHLRPGDVMGRNRSDRFVILQPWADPHDAAVHAERLREVVSDERIVVGDDVAVRVTASVGVAVMPRDGVGPGGLMKAADQALYVAKAAGRNRVYTPHGPVTGMISYAHAGRHAV